MVVYNGNPLFLKWRIWGGEKFSPLFSDFHPSSRYPPSSTKTRTQAPTHNMGTPGPGGAKPVPLEEISRRPNRGFAAWTGPKALAWRWAWLFRWIFFPFTGKGGDFCCWWAFCFGGFFGFQVTKKDLGFYLMILIWLIRIFKNGLI